MDNGFYGGFDAPAFTIRQTPTTAPKKKQQGRGGTLTSLISEGGALGGGAAGAAIGSVIPVVGTAIGGILGAGLGAFGGRLAENKIRDDRWGVGDASGEAALTAALGAPGKALKYGNKAISALKGGDTLATALKSGAQAADSTAPGFLRKKIGEQVGKKGNDLLVKEFGLNPSQQTNYQAKFKEDVTDLIKRRKLTGLSSEDIAETVIKPLQDQFDAIPKSIPAVSRQTLESAFKTKYEPLLKSAVQDNKAKGRQLKDQAKEILAKYGDTVDPNDINRLRKEFDELVTYSDRQANPARYDVNKRAADALRTVLQKEADRAGVTTPNGQTFRELGKELQKLRQFNTNVMRQENNGRGSKPVGLVNAVVGTMTAAATGDPLGAAGGAIASQAMNSPAGRRALAKGAQNLSQKASTPSSRSPIGTGLKIGAMGGLGAATLSGALGNQSLSNSSESPTANTASNAPTTSVNMPQQYSNLNDLSSALAGSQSTMYSRDNAIMDMQRDPANADYYMQLYEFANPKQEANKLNSSTATQLASSANASNTLSQLESLFANAGGGSGKLEGALKTGLARAGLDGSTQTYNDLAASSVSQLARALNGGGQVSDADAAVVIQALPKITDSQEVARNKFAALKARLLAAQQNTLMFGGQASDTGGDLSPALAG